MSDKSDKIVYSTESGDLRKEKAASRSTSGKTRDDMVRVQKESKGRGGKTVSVIYGLPISVNELSALAARLKQKCGAGGTVKEGAIIIQGDKVDFIVQLLQKEGFKVKRAGGE
jgi:translation initiation factor 1